jgi:hypothetical protein
MNMQEVGRAGKAGHGREGGGDAASETSNSADDYFDTARPADHADIIVHNDESRRPVREVRPH